MITRNKTSLLLFPLLLFVCMFLIQIESSKAGTAPSLLLGCCATELGNAVPQTGECIGCQEGTNCAIDESLCIEDGGQFAAGAVCEQQGSQFVCDDPTSSTGCCVIPAQSNCRDDQTLIQCQQVNGGTQWVIGAACSEVENCENGPSPIRNVPTLNQWGLIAIAGILGVIGFIMVIRRRATA